LGTRGDLDSFQAWGNNVYSLVLPLPSHRHDYKNVSIEMLYTDTDLATTTSDGKRLYFDNELKIEVVPGSEARHIQIPAVAARELTKKPFDERAASILDDSGRQVGLSKAAFAKLVYDGTDGFGALDVTAFAPVFKIVKDIMADRDGVERPPDDA
jgi:RNA-directed DNA polymerase